MPQRIDEELERVTKRGETPEAIHVGFGVYSEIQEEQDPLLAADLLAPGRAAPLRPARKEPTEYRGIKLVLEEAEDDDYLRIET